MTYQDRYFELLQQVVNHLKDVQALTQADLESMQEELNDRSCEYCEGTKKVPVAEFDTDSHQWQNGVGEAPCHCTF